MWGEKPWLLVLVVLLLCMILFCKNYLRTVILAFSLPGPLALPLLGNVFMINNNKKLLEIGINAHQMYGKIMRCWVSFIPFIIVYEPEHLQTILSCNKKSKKNILYTFMHNFLGDGLITNNGEKWKFHRKLIQPYFHITVLEMYLQHFSHGAHILAETLRNKTEVNITTYVNHTVFLVLHRSILGIDPEESSPFRQGQLHILKRVTKPWLLVESLFKYTSAADSECKQKLNLHNYTRKVLERKKLYDDKASNSLIDMLIEVSKNSPHFTDEDIINEICTFMLAGQDSTGAALAFSLYLIAKHQDVQEQIIEEQNLILANKHDISLEDLNNMKYLEQCVKEGLRLYPSVPMISRVLTEDVPLDKKCCLPKGTNVFICPFITHRLPHVYKNPQLYMPERFSQKNFKNLHPFAYMPFSLGSRKCIGYQFAYLQIKSILSILLRNYHISLIENKDISLAYRVTLRIKGGVWLHLEPRNKTKF